MSGNMLSTLVKVRGRFARSVHLERDFESPAEFHMTESALRAMEAIKDALLRPSERAITLIGPYGSGKSAFCVHLAHRLRVPKQTGFDIEKGLTPVLRVGAQQALGSSLISALHTTTNRSGEGSSTSNPLAAYSEASAKDLSPRDIADLFACAAKQSPGGLLLIIDEFGKFLEYAALHPTESDPFILQELAEAAARSEPDHPLIVVTVLHQNMEAYARSLTRSQQAEWQKVSERFRQVQFFPSDRERVEIVGCALEHLPELSNHKRISDAVLHYCDAYAKIGLPLIAPEESWRQWAVKAYPIHPLALLALPALFRRVGQSHRSLFTFLSAEEPYAFGSFLQENPFHTDKVPFYTLDSLFNYGATVLAQGSALSREWAEAIEAVENGEGTLSAEAIRVLKALALLGLLRESRLPPSEVLLQAAYPDFSVGEILKELQERKRIVYRRRLNTYRIWEGGDVDVEGVLQVARTRLTHSSAALKVADALCKAETQIARRHSYQTGTIRAIYLTPCTLAELPKAVTAANNSLQVLLCLITNTSELEEAESHLKNLTKPSILVILAQETERLRDSALDVLAAKQVFSEVKELEQDRAARRELSARYSDAQTAFRSEWDHLFTPSTQGGDSSTRFWYQGKSQEIKALVPFFSEMADNTYPQSPRLRNELINRRALSSAAAAARRNLIEAMLNPKSVALPHLDITGFPPERSMYECLLGATGLHRETPEGYRLVPPHEHNDPARILPAWSD